MGSRLWLCWSFLTLLGVGYVAFAISIEGTATRAHLLPGETTHGHYQIELKCAACHTRFLGVKRDACTRCHAEELRRAKDTHPARKFNDPTSAHRLAKIDAQNCVTCHEEHRPHHTGSMGVSVPSDYCYHCHEDVASQRPSHDGMNHDSCAATGCHNYHDNRALYEKFLVKHGDDLDVLASPAVVIRKLTARAKVQALSVEDADAPADLLRESIVNDWAATGHASVGVNCRDCHDTASADGKIRRWENQVSHESCASCHANEVEGFLRGRHGMRLAEGLSPMRPAWSRLPMHDDAAHRQLNCSSCHASHRFETTTAAVESCLQCHRDEHSSGYLSSRHYQLWKDEVEGRSMPGSGVSCATCHLPRYEDGDSVKVQHNQNNNLRPREKMVRSVCMGCHGLEFSLSSLADSKVVQSGFTAAPTVHVESVEMARRWFASQAKKRQRRQNDD